MLTATRKGFNYDDLFVGMAREFAKTITYGDILTFAEVSGDNNPMHLDEEFARSTFFRGRVAHGMLTASLISTIVGTLLPGPGCVYLGQNLKFLSPVRIGDTVTARASVKELIPARKQAVLRTTCQVAETVVVDGDALVWLPA